MNTAEKLAIATVAIIIIVKIAFIIAILVGYLMNVVHIIKTPEAQTATTTNIICDIGVIPVPLTAPIGAVCGFVR